MKFLGSSEIKTNRLVLKVPTMIEQYDLWNILRNEEVNKWYMPTPSRFNGDRNVFLESLNNWDKQKVFYQKKIDNLDNNSNMFTWSIFLGDIVIGQITVQPCDQYSNNPEIRDIGWFIDPKYQGNGYGYEAAFEVLKYMFNEIEIEKIITCAAQINCASWKLMEKLGFIRTGEKDSPYLDENGNYLLAFCYEIDKDKFENKIERK